MLSSSSTTTTLPAALFQPIGSWIGHNLLYSESIESDQRIPCFTFTAIEGGKYGLLAPSLRFWLATIVVLSLGAIYGATLSCVMYQFIILPRKKQNSRQSSSLSLSSQLIGFGIIMPLCVVYPYYGIRFFLIKNIMMKFFFGIASITTCFRCSETMFDFLPTHVDDSLWNFIVYNAFPSECKFDKDGPVKSKWSDVRYYLRKFGVSMLFLGIYSSLLIPFDYKLYPTMEGPNLKDLSIWNAFSWHQLANNFSIASEFSR